MAAGGDHGLALKEGRVFAWGVTPGASGWLEPVTVPAEAQAGVSAIDAGRGFSVALKGGEVLAWGDLRYGVTAVPAEAKSGVSAVAAGETHIVALKNGGVISWGGEPGIFPPDVPEEARSGVTAVAAGRGWSMALKDGRVITWGWNGVAVPLEAQSNIVAIDAGYAYALALTDQGRVIAWGSNQVGQLLVPSDAMSGVDRISAGAYMWLAVKDGRIIAPNWPATRVPGWGQSGVLAVAAADAAWALVIRGPATPPGPVTSLKAAARLGSVAVGWAPPLDTGDPAGVSYEYRAGAGRWIATTTTKAMVKGTKGKVLTISVRAVNSAGPGPETNITGKPR